MLKDFFENNNTVFNIHIPRTAGSTLNTFFQKKKILLTDTIVSRKDFQVKEEFLSTTQIRKGTFLIIWTQALSLI